MEKFAYSVDETREALSLGRTKIFELISAGTLRTFKVGRRTLIKADSIRELVRDEAA